MNFWQYITITIIGLTLTAILGVIGFLIKSYIDKTYNALKEFSATLKDFYKTVTEIKVSLSTIIEDNKNMNANCDMKHRIIDKAINDHTIKINKIEKDVIILQQKK